MTRWPLHHQPSYPTNQPSWHIFFFYLREANFISFAINPPFIRIQPGSSMAVVATFGAIGTIGKIVGWIGRRPRSTVWRKGLILLLFQTRSAVSRQSFYKNGNKGTNFANTYYNNIIELPKPQSSIGSTSNFCDRPNKTNQRVLNQIDVQDTPSEIDLTFVSGNPRIFTVQI